MFRFKRLFSTLLVMILCFNILSLTSYAENTPQPVRYTVLLLDTEKSFTMSSAGVQIYKVDTPVDVIKEAARKFVDQIQSAYGTNYVAVISYSSNAKVESNFTTDVSTLHKAIDAIHIGGQWANINAALTKADNLLNDIAAGAEKNIVLFTQGINFEGEHSVSGHYTKDDCDWYRTDNSIHTYEYSNVTYKTAQQLQQKYNIYSIGLFQRFDAVPEAGMSMLNFAKRFSADLQNKGFYDVENVNDLPIVFEDVASDIINPLNLELSYTNKTVESQNGRDGYIEITIHAKIVNNSSADALGAKIRIDNTPGLTLNNTPYEYALGNIPAKSFASATWTLNAEIPQGEKEYPVKFVVGSSNSVAVEQYLTISVRGNISAEEFLDKDRWQFTHGAVKNNVINKKDRLWLFDYYIDNKTLDKLQTEYEDMITSEWGGSCYGMSISALLFKLNRLTPSFWNEHASSIGDLQVDDVRSLINYYHLMQHTPEHRDIYTQTGKMSGVERIQTLEDKVRDSVVALAFDWSFKKVEEGEDKDHSHMVLAYGDPESNSTGWKIGKTTYHNRIKLYDVNLYDVNCLVDDGHYYEEYFYYEWENILWIPTVEWTIAAERDGKYYDFYFGGGKNLQDKRITFIADDIAALDIRNIEMRDVGNSGSKNTQCYLIAKELTNFIRIMKSTGEYSDIYGLVSAGNITFNTYYDTCYLPNNNSTPALNVMIDNEAYRIVNINNLETLNLRMEYPDVYAYAEIDHCVQVEFDPSGVIEASGNNLSYQLSLVFNDGFLSMPWYKTMIRGANANEVKMAQTATGIIVTSDNLNDITITATGKAGEDTLKISTDEKTVFITSNINGDPVAMIDANHDGIYDTVLSNDAVTGNNSPFEYDSWYGPLMILYNREFNISAAANEGGAITPVGISKVKYNKNITYTITPDEGYVIVNVLVDGHPVGAVSEYTIQHVKAHHTITAIFEKIHP